MNKIGQVAIVCVAVGIVYLAMLIIMPFVGDMASTANVTMAASSNLTQYPGAAEGVLAAPWILWWVPGVIGLVCVIIVLKRPD